MKQLYRECYQTIDPDRLMRHTEAIYRREFGQTFQHYHQAAQYIHQALGAAGIPNAELLSFPADGRTSYNDIRMPLAWEASVGRLTLLNAPGGKSAPKVVADYSVHPFHLVKGSVATPPGGRVVRILTEQQMLAGEDPRGALVMLEPFTGPRAAALKQILDLGGLGLISDHMAGRYVYPDSLIWLNACTESAAWHVMADDRPFIGFSVSPRTADKIRYAANRVPLAARVECDGRREAGVLPAVTALIPGRRPEEVWVYAHTCEPLSFDDANGVAACLETAIQVMRRGTPEFSVRLLFAMELYGFMAFIAERAAGLRGRIIGGCNYDALGSVKGEIVSCHLAGRGTPFFGNYLFEHLIGELKDEPLALPCELCGPAYFDDISFSDPTIGIPAVWPLGGFGPTHHSSVQTMDFLDAETFRRGTALNTAFILALANPRAEWLVPATELAVNHLRTERARIAEAPFGIDAERLAHVCDIQHRHLNDFKRALDPRLVDEALQKLTASHAGLAGDLRGTEMPAADEGNWRGLAGAMVLRRATAGFPHNLVRVPAEKRSYELPDGVIYGHLANVLANMDGKKDLGRLLREAEYERNAPLPEARIKRQVVAINFLADHGYLQVVRRPELSETDVLAALRAVGVCDGDLLLIHCALSNFGYIRGGANTVLKAIQQAVGARGTAIFAAFTNPFIMLGDLNRCRGYRPYEASDLAQIETGAVVRTLLADWPAARRSRHITHSWAGFGPRAAACLDAHGAYDPPGDESSPMARALELGGKLLHFGSSLATTTFIHFLEDHCRLPYLETSVCREKMADGSLRTVLVERNFGGHRDFYRNTEAERCKFFTQAQAAGLRIATQQMGVGKLRLMDLKQLFDIGSALMRRDPRITLCDDANCAFCSRINASSGNV